MAQFSRNFYSSQ